MRINNYLCHPDIGLKVTLTIQENVDMYSDRHDVIASDVNKAVNSYILCKYNFSVTLDNKRSSFRR